LLMAAPWAISRSEARCTPRSPINRYVLRMSCACLAECCCSRGLWLSCGTAIGNVCIRGL